MPSKSSERVIRFVDALPLCSDMRVLEIGCGPGVAAREVARRVGGGFVLGIDRSEKAISTARRLSVEEITSGHLGFRVSAIEAFERGDNEPRFDLCFAMRVGAFDGRHPEIGAQAMVRIKSSLRTGGRFFIDTGDPLKEVDL
ncbi:methyltransferase domain-containing protein [Roseibium sp. HPY-6]|uniref:class I SAM-dependent methyltransferase n=1 Tax=Roseibium sp. HPY-6 TaxID=3229852 RepID=UPI00338FF8FB